MFDCPIVKSDWLLQNCNAYNHLKVSWLKDKARRVGLSDCSDLQALMPYLSHKNHILDVGAGYGRVLNYLDQRGFKNIEGIDYVPHFIQEASKVNEHIRLYRGDFLTYVFNNKYDVVFMLWAFIMEFDRATQLRLIRKGLQILAPQGILVVELIDNQLPDECSSTEDGIIELDMDGYPFNGVITSVEDIKAILRKVGANLTGLFTYRTDNNNVRTLMIISRV